MAKFGEMFQEADWKQEKHVPVIKAPGRIGKGEPCAITVGVGAEVSHPNTTAHHIRWIRVFFLPRGAKFPYHVATIEFAAHGESTDGADTSGVYTHHQATVHLKTDHPGTILASSYCNIHGLWESEKELDVG